MCYNSSPLHLNANDEVTVSVLCLEIKKANKRYMSELIYVKTHIMGNVIFKIRALKWKENVICI